MNGTTIEAIETIIAAAEFNADTARASFFGSSHAADYQDKIAARMREVLADARAGRTTSACDECDGLGYRYIEDGCGCCGGTDRCLYCQDGQVPIEQYVSDYGFIV